MSKIKVHYLLNDSNLLELNALESSIVEFFPISKSVRDAEVLLTDGTKLEAAKDLASMPKTKIVLYEPLLMKYIFNSNCSYLQVPNLSFFQSEIFNFYYQDKYFEDFERIAGYKVSDFFSFGPCEDSFLKNAYAKDFNVFNLMFSMNWLKVFLSHLKRKNIFEAPFEIDFYKRDNLLKMEAKAFLKGSLEEEFDFSLMKGDSGEGEFIGSLRSLSPFCEFLFLTEDKNNRVLYIEVVFDRFPSKNFVFGHDLNSFYERNNQRDAFFNPIGANLEIDDFEEIDKITLQKGDPYSVFNQSEIFSRHTLGLEEIAYHVKNRADQKYPNTELNKDIFLEVLESLGFNLKKIRDDEKEALFNLCKNKNTLDLYVNVKNKAIEDQEDFSIDQNEVVDFISEFKDFHLVDLNLIKVESSTRDKEEGDPNLEVVKLDAEKSEIENDLERVEGTELIEEGQKKIEGSEEDYSVSGHVLSGEGLLEEDDEIETVSGEESEDDQVQTVVKGFKEDLTAEIIRISGGEPVNSNQFSTAFKNISTTHFGINDEESDLIGRKIYKNLISKKVDEGLVSFDPNNFSKKIINMSNEIEKREKRIGDLESLIHTLSINKKANNKVLNPELRNMTVGQSFKNLDEANAMLEKKDAKIEMLEKKIKYVEGKAQDNSYFHLKDDLTRLSKDKEDALEAKEKLESFKALGKGLSKKIKASNQKMNQYRLKMNELLNREKKFMLEAKVANHKNLILEKKLNIMKKKISSIDRAEDPGALASSEVEGNINVDDKLKNKAKVLEIKSRHLELNNEKLKSNLKSSVSHLQQSKKENHKLKLQIRLLEQQVKLLNKKKAS